MLTKRILFCKTIVESVCKKCITYSYAKCEGRHLNVPSDIYTLNFSKNCLLKSDMNTKSTCPLPRSSFPIRKSAPVQFPVHFAQVHKIISFVGQLVFQFASSLEYPHFQGMHGGHLGGCLHSLGVQLVVCHCLHSWQSWVPGSKHT